MTGVRIKRRNLDANMYAGRIPCEQNGRDWVMHLQAKQHQRLLVDHQKLWKKHGPDSPSQVSEGANFADILISDF